MAELSKFPKDWKVGRLGEGLSLIRNGLVSNQNKDGNGLPVTRIETISEEKIDNQKVGYIEKVSEKELSEYKLQKGDILFSHINSLEHIGKTAIYDGIPSLLLHGMNLLLLRPQKSIFIPYYLLHLLKHFREKSIFRNLSKKAVNQASINQTELSKVNLPLPPLPEQKKIAEVLTTADEAIELSDKIIEKLKKLKSGLMQRLLTQGIEHKEFKDTEIGRIPKDWKVVRLGDEMLFEIIMGQSPPSSTYNKSTEGLPFLQGKIEFGEIFPKPIIYCTKPIKVSEKGDILVSVRAPVGEVNISQSKICIGRGLSALRCKPDKISHLFLFYYLKHSGNKLEKISGGSTFKAIRKDDLVRFEISLPPLPEQKKIAEILNSVDERIEAEGKRKERFERIKRGLMNDLLTGKKRLRV